jgi:hypothetical protein
MRIGNKKMSNEKAATSSNQTAAIPVATQDRLGLLIELLLSSQQSELETREARKQQQAALAVQREKNANNNAYNLMVYQAKCLHIKGKGRKANYSPEGQAAIRRDDPAVMFHPSVPTSVRHR